jgi:hypothetical protein
MSRMEGSDATMLDSWVEGTAQWCPTLQLGGRNCAASLDSAMFTLTRVVPSLEFHAGGREEKKG